MIHQLIFANPRPGMSPKEFQDYWINIHAKNFASKIPQIKKYKVCRVMPSDPAPIFNGMAEIWLENEAEQLKSLQSTEFIDGARADEPKWAAFWESLCLDTDAVPILEADDIYRNKLVIIVKRKGGIPLSVFRKYAFDTVGKVIRGFSGLKAACLCVVKDGYYAVGEARFDAAYQLWFESSGAAEAAKKSADYNALIQELNSSCDSLFEFVCEENIII